MSSGILTLAQQPRWLLLSLFLILWSWSTGLRRDGKAVGFGVDARAAPFWEAKRQVGIPICAEQCALQAQEAIGCGDSLNLQCACHSAQFFPGAVDCMTANCTAGEKQDGQDALMTACKAVGTSVSLPTSFTGTSTSITSGVPSISGSASSATTTPPSSGSGSGSSSPSSGSGGGSQTATPTTTATAPPSSTTGTGSSTGTSSGSGSGTTASGTGIQASGSTPSTTGTSGSGNGAGARGVSWSAVAVGVALAVAGTASTLNCASLEPPRS